MIQKIVNRLLAYEGGILYRCCSKAVLRPLEGISFFFFQQAHPARRMPSRP